MKSISDAWFIHVEITNYCGRNCLYCSRYDRYIPDEKRYHMDLEYFDVVLNSLKNWKNRIALIGGEPVMHPKFEKICYMIQSYYPREKMGIWISTYGRYKKLIEETFGFVAYNPHEKKDVCYHQPITVASRDVVPDDKLRAVLINDCWVQRTWCPSINPLGGFFCEVAAAMAILFDRKGFNILDRQWMDYSPGQFKDQVETFCQLCGMCVPIERQNLCNDVEKISPSIINLFLAHGITIKKEYEIFIDTFSNNQIIEKSKSWTPGNYRGDMYDDSIAPEGLGVTVNLDGFRE